VARDPELARRIGADMVMGTFDEIAALPGAVEMVAVRIAMRFLSSNKGQTALIVMGLAIGIAIQLSSGSCCRTSGRASSRRSPRTRRT